jgi:hypothetical protein
MLLCLDRAPARRKDVPEIVAVPILCLSREMKVNVFFGTNADQLTKDIQAWLDSDGVEVTAACQSQGTRTGEEGVFVTVFYK